jgi:hypothetical protein
MDDAADWEASYRFRHDEDATTAQIVRPHVDMTIERCRSARRAIIAHETTELEDGQLHGQFALAVSDDGNDQLRPLGVLSFAIHLRQGGKARRQTLVQEAENELGARSAIHVLDRETDCTAIMAALVGENTRFVIRIAGGKPARVGAGAVTVGETLVVAPVPAGRKVAASGRGRSPVPAREGKLQVSAARVTLAQPDSTSQCKHETLMVNAVRVLEPDPPPGETPIEWRLWTNEPVDTAEEALAVVDAYRCAWMIDEYLRALRTMWACDNGEFETEEQRIEALAAYVPVAWRLLLLRTLSRDQSDAPATEVLTPTQLRCLRGALAELKRPKLPAKPTVREAMLGVAGLGGHIKNNGDPGWTVLGRGLDTLLTMEIGYRFALERSRG